VFDEVLGGFEPEQREALEHVVALVRRVVPEATEGRSYGLPTFRCAASRCSASQRVRTT
jgi:uncharacterized protein YdhG (YjbR/CyaY superfamily)